MKGALLAAAALFGSAVSATIHGRHAHQKFHDLVGRGDEEAAPANSTFGCTTYVTTITGQAVLGQPTITISSTTTETLTTTIAAGPVPLVTTCATPGTYTFPATTITVTEETTVCGAATTTLASGTQTYGGVTTVVETETTIVCPYATVSPVGSTVTSILTTTTYVCPAAGTYTIAPTTTYVPQSTIVVYPTPASYSPGTYTQPATTVTVTETDFVYVCPYTSLGAPAPTSVAPASSSTAPAPAQSSASSSPAVGAGSGDKWCMTYSPYTASGGCKGASDVAIDIAVIAGKGFTSIRIYSTDCGGLESVGAAAKDHGLKLVLGIFITAEGIDASRSQLTDIISWGQFELVELVVVGNEAIFNNYCSADQLAAYISEVKSALEGAGYSGPCTTTEPLNILQEVGSELCTAIDVMGSNMHPFFNSGVSASQAGTFLAGQIEIAAGICSGKDVFVLETGWPHAGDANGLAIPSPSEQAIAIAAIQDVAGKNAVFFSFEDDLWKQPGPLGVEQSWGCADQFEGN